MNWHYNTQDRHQEDGTTKSPFRSVRFQLTGTQNSVAAYLNMLETVFSLAEVSDPIPARHGRIEVTGIMFRRHPLKGGPR